MRITAKLLLASLILAGLLNMATAGQTAWYYHVKTGGTGGKPVQSEAEPGLSSCWNSINAAFAAVKSRATPGPWIIQVDDEVTYDEAVRLFDFQTSSIETLTLTKAPWLAGRPTIYPSQPQKMALAINGRWPGSSEPLPGQPGQPSRRVTYVTVRGFTLKSNASGTKQWVFNDNQTYLTEGLHIIEDCHFDGQNQVYEAQVPISIHGTCINTVFRRNVFRNFTKHSMKGMGVVFVTTYPVLTVVGEPTITIAENTFHGNNNGCVFEAYGDAINERYYKVVFERNTLSGNYSGAHNLVAFVDNPLLNIVRNNIFSGNVGNNTWGATLVIAKSSNTKTYHNTFLNNHTGSEVRVSAGSTEGLEIKNNIFWPKPGSYCIEVQRGCTDHLVSANNVFFTDFENDGSPPGFGFSLTENTEIVGLWNDKAMTTDAWNKASKNNAGNGYTIEGPGLDKTMHLAAGSLCIDRGVSGLVSDDLDGGQRPVGDGFDIGAEEYGTTGKARSLGREQEPQLEGQQLALSAPLHLAAYQGDLAKIKVSIQEGVELNKLDGRGYAPLHYAAQSNQKPAMELLIGKGGNINIKDSRGHTPLFYAIAARHRDVAELLISNGAEVNVKSKTGQAPLDVSLSQNRKAIVEGLVAEASIPRGPSLPLAAASGDIERVRSLLAQGANVNEKDRNGSTPLHNAAAKGRKDVVQMLLEKGASVDATDPLGRTPLHLASRLRVKYVPALLLAKGAKANARGYQGNTPLHVAAGRDQVRADFLEFLLAKGADVNARNGRCETPLHLVPATNEWQEGRGLAVGILLAHGAEVDATDENGRTPLHVAAENGQAKVVERLLAKGVAVDKKANDGLTPIHRAVLAGHKEVVQLLVAKGANVNTAPPSGETPLHEAAKAGHNEIAEFLIAKGANVNAKNARGDTPAQAALAQAPPGMVRLLLAKGGEASTIQLAAYLGDLARLKGHLEKGISVNAQDGYGLTPLHAAAATGQKEVVEFLIAAGADVNAGSGLGGLGTPLHYAAQGGSRGVADRLLLKGANVSARNNKGETPLHLAAQKGYTDLCQLLIAKNANVNIRANGSTPLHYAAASGQKDVAALLLEQGADIDLRNRGGETPVEVAADKKHKEVTRLLVDKGADLSLPDLLYHAVWRGDRELAETLIKKGADVNSESEFWGCAPSLYAAWGDNPDVLELLLAHGANPNATSGDEFLLHIMHYAARGPDTIRMLLDQGANPNAIDQRGQTPFHWWAQGDYKMGEELVKAKAEMELLIARGADLNAKDYDGQTALSLAKEKGHKEIVTLLRQHGAKE